MTVFAEALRTRQTPWAIRARRAARERHIRTSTRAAGWTLLVGGSVFIASRTDHWQDRQHGAWRKRGETEAMVRWLRSKRHRRLLSGVIPVDRDRLQRLYGFQMQQPQLERRETYDELLADR